MRPERGGVEPRRSHFGKALKDRRNRVARLANCALVVPCVRRERFKRLPGDGDGVAGRGKRGQTVAAERVNVGNSAGVPLLLGLRKRNNGHGRKRDGRSDRRAAALALVAPAQPQKHGDRENDNHGDHRDGAGEFKRLLRGLASGGEGAEEARRLALVAVPVWPAVMSAPPVMAAAPLGVAFRAGLLDRALRNILRIASGLGSGPVAGENVGVGGEKRLRRGVRLLRFVRQRENVAIKPRWRSAPARFPEKTAREIGRRL